jgi:hypothetical protein
MSSDGPLWLVMRQDEIDAVRRSMSATAWLACQKAAKDIPGAIAIVRGTPIARISK